MKKNNLPNLGRPLVGDSKRDKYLKIYLSDSEYKSLEDLENLLKIYYDQEGFYYNRPNHFRLLIHNLINPHVLKFLFENLTSELEKLKKL